MKTNKSIGLLLKKIRNHRGLTGISVAHKMGISRQALSRYENGVVDMTTGMLYRWGQAIIGNRVSWRSIGEALSEAKRGSFRSHTKKSLATIILFLSLTGVANAGCRIVGTRYTDSSMSNTPSGRIYKFTVANSEFRYRNKTQCETELATGQIIQCQTKSFVKCVCMC